MSIITMLNIAAAIIGGLFVLFGIVTTYVSYLCIKGKIKPNGAVGVRLNFSRNYRLYQQDKYWYPINRYGGEKTIYLTALWTLLSLVITVLPIDPGVKINALAVVIILVATALVFAAWRIYQYADNLVSGDVAYR
jgi:hypothetical protein